MQRQGDQQRAEHISAQCGRIDQEGYGYSERDQHRQQEPAVAEPGAEQQIKCGKRSCSKQYGEEPQPDGGVEKGGLEFDPETQQERIADLVVWDGIIEVDRRRIRGQREIEYRERFIEPEGTEQETADEPHVRPENDQQRQKVIPLFGQRGFLPLSNYR